MSKRVKTKYPGVFYREAKRIGGTGTEKIYYIVFKQDGKVFEEKVGRQYADDMTEARANRIRAERIEGKRQSRKEIREEATAVKNAEENKWTIAKLWDLYCETHPENKILRHEARKFDHYLRNGLGTKEPAELVSLDVDRIRLKIQKQGKYTTAARILELLRRTVNFGVKQGLVPSIRFEIEVPRLNNKVTEDLTPDQLTALLEALDSATDQTAANVMRLALYSGMRRTDIFKLKWSDIDWSMGFIKVVDPKGGQEQTIPLTNSARAVFESINPTEGNPYVFPGSINGAHLSECRRGLTSIAAASGLPKGFRPLHGLRHTYASMLASSGRVDLYTLQKLLTHKSPAMTERYAHLRNEALKRAASVSDDIIGAIQAHAKNVVDMPERERRK